MTMINQNLQFVSFFNNLDDSVDIYSIMKKSQTRVFSWLSLHKQLE